MDLRQQLLRDEGTRLNIYRDTEGKATIGCGRNLDAKGINEDEMLLMLENDIKDAEHQLSTRIPWTDLLDQVRRDALINLCFNMGIGNLLQFRKFLGHLQLGQFIEAAQELIDSDYGRSETKFRAARLAKQIVDGAYQ